MLLRHRSIFATVSLVLLLLCISFSSATGAIQEASNSKEAATPPGVEQGSDVDSADRDSIARFFEELQTKFDLNDSNSGFEYLELAEMEAVIRNNARVIQKPESGTEFADALKRHWPTAMDSFQQEFYWTRHRILKIEKVNDRQLAVTVRHYQQADELYLKLKWTVVRQADGSWKIGNIEDIEQGVAVTALLAVLVAPNDGQADWVLPTKQWLLTNGEKAFFDEDMNPSAEIMDAADQILELQPPTDIQAFLLTLKVSIWMVSDDASQADVDVHNFAQLPGEHPLVYYFKGGLLMSEENYSGAIEQYERYAQLTGWDPDVCEAIADCYWHMEEYKKAVEFAIRGLDDEPDSLGCLATLAITLPDDRKSELGVWFEKNKFDEQLLTSIIEWALTNNDQVAASYLFGVLKTHHPRSPSVKELQMLIDH